MEKKLPADIEDTIKRVKEWQNKNIKYDKIEGGITNNNYLVAADNKKYFVKIPGAGTENFIDRNNCFAADTIAMKSGVGPAVIEYFPDTGVSIWEYLDGYRQLTFGDVYKKKIFIKILETIRIFHKSRDGVLPLKTTIFEQARKMIDESKTLGFKPPEFERIIFLVNVIEESVHQDGIDWSPTHNDMWTNNFLYNDATEDMKIIDLEYATMNDPYNDLGTYSAGNVLSEGMDVEMCKIYHNGWDEKGFAKIKLYKIAAAIKWGFWALQQHLNSNVKFDYIQWFGVQFDQLRKAMNDPRIDYWISTVKGRSPFIE